MNRRVGKRRACRKGNARRLSHKLHGFTFIEPVPLTPATVAVIVTVPAAMPFTTPVLPVATPRLSVLVRIATRVSLLAHFVFLATRVSPVASRGHALSDTDFPTITLSAAGLTLTEAKDTGVTVIFEVPLLPSIAAVTVVDPAALAVTIPVGLTGATVVSLLVQITV